jgi:hypothetical protein
MHKTTLFSLAAATTMRAVPSPSPREAASRCRRCVKPCSTPSSAHTFATLNEFPLDREANHQGNVTVAKGMTCPTSSLLEPQTAD